MRKSVAVFVLAAVVSLGLMAGSSAADDAATVTALLQNPTEGLNCSAQSSANTPGYCERKSGASGAGRNGKTGTGKDMRLARGNECPPASGSYCSDQFPVCCFKNDKYYCAASLSRC